MKSWNLELQLNVCIGVDVDGVDDADELDPNPIRFCIMLGTNEVEVVELVAAAGGETVLDPRPRKFCDQAGAETPSINSTAASHFELRIRSPFSRNGRSPSDRNKTCRMAGNDSNRGHRVKTEFRVGAAPEFGIAGSRDSLGRPSTPACGKLADTSATLALHEVLRP
jgi:hypothetical protein